MKSKKTFLIFTYVAICLALGFASGLSSTGSIQTWYADLNKPWFNPPNWIFGPAWTILYILMGAAAGIVHSYGLDNVNVKKAIGFFIMQFVLNLLWTPVFFSWHQPMISLGIIIVLWFLILLTIRAFRQVDKAAATMLYPYILWVSFATALNLSIVILN